jgi:hypothetical protein
MTNKEDNEEVAHSIYGQIGTKLQLPSKSEPPFKYLGVLHDFNSLDVHQYSDSITISCTSYIDHILKTHGWMAPSVEGNEHHSSLLPIDAVNFMYSKVGPSEGTPQAADLSAKHGFSYCSLLTFQTNEETKANTEPTDNRQTDRQKINSLRIYLFTNWNKLKNQRKKETK